MPFIRTVKDLLKSMSAEELEEAIVEYGLGDDIHPYQLESLLKKAREKNGQAV